MQDHQSIKSVTNNEKPLPFYDDGYGPLFIFKESCGAWLFPVALIRAKNWNDAYEICQDEFHSEAGSIDDILKECNFKTMEQAIDDAGFQETYGFRPNGANSTDVHKHGIFVRDHNGRLEESTIKSLAKDGITVRLKPWVTVCFEDWSEKDVEACETNDKGIDEEISMDSVDDCVEWLSKKGPFSISSDPWQPGSWYSDDSELDYRTLAREVKTYHLRGFTENEEREIYNRLKEAKLV